MSAVSQSVLLMAHWSTGQPEPSWFLPHKALWSSGSRNALELYCRRTKGHIWNLTCKAMMEMTWMKVHAPQSDVHTAAIWSHVLFLVRKEDIIYDPYGSSLHICIGMLNPALVCTFFLACLSAGTFFRWVYLLVLPTWRLLFSSCGRVYGCQVQSLGRRFCQSFFV